MIFLTSKAYLREVNYFLNLRICKPEIFNPPDVRFLNFIKMNLSKIQVYLVDDHQVLLDGLNQLLKNEPNIQIVGMAQNGQQLLDQLENWTKKKGKPQVDVILMDINMPVMDGLKATERIKQLYPNIKVLMLTTLSQIKDLREAEKRGADGFLSKNKGKEEIIDAIQKVYSNKDFIVCADLDKSKAVAKNDQSPTSKTLLSFRERQIIALICQEHSLEDIARVLSLSSQSISAQRKNICSKLGVTTNAGITREAVKHGWCNMP